jgi:hypothetical protein
VYVVLRNTEAASTCEKQVQVRGVSIPGKTKEANVGADTPEVKYTGRYGKVKGSLDAGDSSSN